MAATKVTNYYIAALSMSLHSPHFTPNLVWWLSPPNNFWIDSREKFSWVGWSLTLVQCFMQHFDYSANIESNLQCVGRCSFCESFLKCTNLCSNVPPNVFTVISKCVSRCAGDRGLQILHGSWDPVSTYKSSNDTIYRCSSHRRHKLFNWVT